MRIKASEHWVHCAVNTPTGWKGRIAMALRRLADKIDGHDTLAMMLLSIPPITRGEKNECINKGWGFIKKSFILSVETEHKDLLFKSNNPHLHEPERK